MEVDWDLHAVVRACRSTTTTTTLKTTTGETKTQSWSLDKTTLNNNNQQKTCFFQDVFFPDPFQTRNDNSIEQFLNDLNNPLEFGKVPKLSSSSQTLPISPLSVLGGLQDPPLQQENKQQQQQKQNKQVVVQGKQQQQQAFGISRCTNSNAQSTRPKKRKNQMKRVCQVPAEGISSDVWSWRKYGQKPIKGSPYPRGYYRCSTSKGCLARKQVERNRSDPDMFIVTYTGEHSHPIPTHRNSLAGSTRNKPTNSGDDDVTNKTNKPSSSPLPEKPEDNDTGTDDDNFDMVMDEDFFEGLDELVGPYPGDDLPGRVILVIVTYS